MPMMMGWWGWSWWTWPMMLFWSAFWIVNLVAILWALIDISHRKKDTGYKLIWAAIVIVLAIVGVLIYLLVERKK